MYSTCTYLGPGSRLDQEIAFLVIVVRAMPYCIESRQYQNLKMIFGHGRISQRWGSPSFKFLQRDILIVTQIKVRIPVCECFRGTTLENLDSKQYIIFYFHNMTRVHSHGIERTKLHTTENDSVQG